MRKIYELIPWYMMSCLEADRVCREGARRSFNSNAVGFAAGIGIGGLALYALSSSSWILPAFIAVITTSIGNAVAVNHNITQKFTFLDQHRQLVRDICDRVSDAYEGALPYD